jgi:hypothetical protein
MATSPLVASPLRPRRAGTEGPTAEQGGGVALTFDELDSEDIFLVVSVVSAKGLLQKQTGDDPMDRNTFVVAKLGDQEKRCAVVESSCDPQFNSHFMFEAAAASRRLTLWVFDASKNSIVDEPLGVVEVPLPASAMPVNIPLFQNKSFALQKPSVDQTSALTEFLLLLK